MTHEVHISRGDLTHPIKPEGVVLIDLVTGLPLDIKAITGTQEDAAASSDTGTFSLLAFVKRALTNWTTLLARIPSLVSGRIPVDATGVTISTTDTLNGTRAYNWSAGTREAFTTASTAAIPLPTMGARREMRVIASARCFVRFGDSGVAAAALTPGHAIFLADCIEVIQIPAGQTHYRVIGETASGNISFTPVA